MKPGAMMVPRPPSGTIDGAPNIQTPSQAHYDPGGCFCFFRSWNYRHRALRIRRRHEG